MFKQSSAKSSQLLESSQVPGTPTLTGSSLAPSEPTVTNFERHLSEAIDRYHRRPKGSARPDASGNDVGSNQAELPSLLKGQQVGEPLRGRLKVIAESDPSRAREIVSLAASTSQSLDQWGFMVVVR